MRTTMNKIDYYYMLTRLSAGNCLAIDSDYNNMKELIDEYFELKHFYDNYQKQLNDVLDKLNKYLDYCKNDNKHN